MAAVHHFLLAVLAVLLVPACSSPLVPAPERHAPFRQQQPDSDLVERLRGSWQLLGRPGISELERAQALQQYNADLLQLIRRIRHDAHAAGEMPSYDSIDIKFTIGQHKLRLAAIYDDVVPAADVELSSLDERYVLPGVGVPMVGVIPESKLRAEGEPSFNIATRGTVRALCAMLIFRDACKPQLRLFPLLRRESVRIGATHYPLAADWSAPLEIYWNLTRVRKDRLVGLLRPQALRKTTGLSSLEPYNPNKIPVILTHGLASSAGTFDNLVNRLLSEPTIRNNYQFWYFNYPTGVAWTVSARVYRESLQNLRRMVDPHRKNRNWDHMVVLGHSMGGLITRYSQCEEPWKLLSAANVPQKKLQHYLHPKYVDEPFADPALEALRKDYFFRPVQAGLVIYMATPHRGAPVAKYRLATFFSKLVTLPQTLLVEAYNIATLQEDMLLLNPQNAYQWFTSVGQLKPDSYSIRGLQGLSVRPAPTHSVIGNDTHSACPRCSDGIVPYWSSHISWGSETIVKSDHSVQDCAAAADDLKRVLVQYAAMHPAIKAASGRRKPRAPRRSTAQLSHPDGAGHK